MKGLLSIHTRLNKEVSQVLNPSLKPPGVGWAVSRGPSVGAWAVPRRLSPSLLAHLHGLFVRDEKMGTGREAAGQVVSHCWVGHWGSPRGGGASGVAKPTSGGCVKAAQIRTIFQKKFF